MIHSWDPSKMGEVEHEKGNCDVSIALVNSCDGVGYPQKVGDEEPSR
jgi:hypothetical protein